MPPSLYASKSPPPWYLQNSPSPLSSSLSSHTPGIEIPLQVLDDSVGVLVSLGLATQVARDGLALGQGLEDGALDLVGVLVETHVLQHHDGREEQGSWVGQALAGDVGRGAVHGLEDGALVADVAGRGQTQTADQAGAHVGQDVAVQVGHDEDLVVVGGRVRHDLQAGVVQQLAVELDVGVLARDVLGLLEGESQDPLAGLAGDQLDRLHDTVYDDMLDARVFTLGVLSDQDRVDVVVWRLVALDALAGSHVGEQVEGTTEGQVQGDVTLADWGGEGTFEGDEVAVDGFHCLGWDALLAVDEDRRDVDGLPLDGGIGGAEDVLDGLGDLRSNTITLNQ